MKPREINKRLADRCWCGQQMIQQFADRPYRYCPREGLVGHILDERNHDRR